MSGSTIDLAHAALASRCFGCIVSLPVGEALSAFPRFLLAVGLSVMLFPHVTERGEITPFSLMPEFVIGFVLGAPLRYVADVSEMIGELLDTARGQMVSAVLDPLQGHGSSDMATLAKNASVVLALMFGGLEVVVSALARSVEVLPLGSSVADPSLVQGLVRSGAFLLGEGMRLCAVWVGAFLLIDIGCSFVSRVVTGLSFTQTAGILKMCVLFFLLMVLVIQGARLSPGGFTRVVAPWGWDSEAPPLVALSGGQGTTPTYPEGER